MIFMEIEEIRSQNLKRIIKKDFDNNYAAFAKKVKKADSQIYRIFNTGKNGRPLSSKAARSFESMLGLNQGELDQPMADKVNETSAIYNTSQAIQATQVIPVISWVQAGEFNEAIDLFAAGYADETVARINGGGRVYALYVRGDSMTAPAGVAPSFPEGYIIHVDPEQAPNNGDCIIARVKGQDLVTFKQLKIDDNPYLKPLNPNHPNIFEEFEILGKVIGASIKL